MTLNRGRYLGVNVLPVNFLYQRNGTHIWRKANNTLNTSSVFDKHIVKNMADFDQDDWDRAVEDLDEDHQRIDEAPSTQDRLGRFTVVFLILNRTIGSGIFVTPVKVLNGTGSVGASILLWTLGAVVATCGLLVWLELGLSLPLRVVQTMPGIFERKSVPRSGGEKNYVRILQNP